MPVYEIGTVEALLGGLAEANASGAAQATGESISEWLARAQMERVLQESELGGSPVYNWNIDPAAQRSFEKVVSSDEANLRQAWDQWQLERAVSENGAATQPPNIETNPTTAMKGAGASGGTLGGILTMSLPTWVAAVAPILGVAVGVGLYELSPSLWEKISRALLPFCYDDSQVMPAVVDENGQAYISKEALEALKQVFLEEGIPVEGEEGSATSDLLDFAVPYGDSYSSNFDQTIYGTTYHYESVTAGKVVAYTDANGNTVVIGISDSQGIVAHTVTIVTNTTTGEQSIREYDWVSQVSRTIDGKTVYYGAASSGTSIANYQGPEIIPYSVSQGRWGEMAWTVEYGDTTSPGEYQPGTSKWGGSSVDYDNLPVTEVYTNPDSETGDPIPFIPAQLPSQAGQSNDPATNPDPTAESTNDQLSRYLSPTVSSTEYPEGSDNKTDDISLDKFAPIPVPSPSGADTSSSETNPSKPSSGKGQKFVDLIPPLPEGIIPSPNMPSVPTGTLGVGAGLVSVYNPTASELEAFTNWLWVTYQDATIDKIWNNPFDGVISLHELYATPNRGGRRYIKSGFLVSTVESTVVPNRYSEIDCGTVVFPEFYGNYLDYSPYSRCHCYLPFIGFVELNIDDIVGSAVNIKYRIDSYTGSCIAIIRCAKEEFESTMYQFNGNCSCTIPVSGGTQASIKAGQMVANAQLSAAQMAGTGGILGGIASLLHGNLGGIGQIESGYATQKYGEANAISATVAAKSSVQHSGVFSDTAGAMGNKKPFIIIRRPVQVRVPNYQELYGFPSHKYVTIKNCAGFIRCREVHVISATANDEEKSLIEQLLKSGVYMT